MLILTVTTLLIIIGLIGTILPVIPGTVVAFAGMLLHKLILGPLSVSWEFIFIALAITVATILIDFAATWWGARVFGASRKGALGAVIGGIAGFLFFNLPGLILGPIVGAILFELLDNRSGMDAAKAGFGTVVGAGVAFMVKLALTVLMVSSFYLSLPAAVI